MGSGLRKSPPELNAAAVSTGGGTASAVTGPAGAAAAAVNTSSRHSGRNTIAVSDAAAAASNTSSAPNPGGSINATSSGHSHPTATSSGHSQPSVNTGQNLDIHDASSFPVPAITAQDNIQYTAAVKMIHPCLTSLQRKQPLKSKENPDLLKDELEGL